MIPEIERKAVLALFPYFSRLFPSIIDVGSNKGDWASVLVQNVSVARLFEPNEILLHYSQVRFRHIRHIFYNALAVSDDHGEVEFIYFEDEHDGLSNIIGNDRWDYLSPLRKKVKCIPLWSIAGRDTRADLLKIDVEGAEMKVLKGAEMILKQKGIKFIEVEHADHIEVTGYKFQDIIDYLQPFGYAPFHFDGENFIPFIDQQAENIFFMDAHFTQDWNKEFIKNTRGLGPFNFVLEIGCFEGLTTRYICDNLLTKEGRMIAVDPLEDQYTDEADEETNKMFVGQFERFTRNTRGYPVELKRERSQNVFKGDFMHYRFDFIYVDGHHGEVEVFEDGCNAFKVLRKGGYMLFDDYQGYRDETTRGIDRFIDLHQGKMTIKIKEYQLLIQKHTD